MSVGPIENGDVYINLNCPNQAIENLWFMANRTAKEEMLHTALTVISINKPVNVALVTVEQFGTINRLHVATS